MGGMRVTARLGLVSILCATIIEVGSPLIAGPTQGQSFEARLREAQVLLETSEPEEALKAFKEANALRGGHSPDCLLGAARAYLQLGEYKKMIASCDEALAVAGADVSQSALAHSLRGIA